LSQKLHNPPAINHDPKKEQGLCFWTISCLSTTFVMGQ
jgi:hypothetical protein